MAFSNLWKRRADAAAAQCRVAARLDGCFCGIGVVGEKEVEEMKTDIIELESTLSQQDMIISQTPEKKVVRLSS